MADLVYILRDERGASNTASAPNQSKEVISAMANFYDSRISAKSQDEPSIEALREALDYCPKTGFFTWKKTKDPGRIGSRAGCARANQYRNIYVLGASRPEHRLAWAMYYGTWPDKFIDHINHDGCDNRIENLRLASLRDNNRNVRPQTNRASKFKGVWRRKKRWTAYITVKKGERIRLGIFDTQEEAARAYDASAKSNWGEFAYLNFPDEATK